MEVLTTLKPGDKDTKNLLRKYGEKLVTVRYRYNRAKGMRYKTVELIEDVQPWNPILRYHPNRQTPIRITYEENTLREQVKANGGYWDSKRKLWILRYQKVLELKLESRMIIE